ncbi:MAG: YaiI/YqxD family protein [Bdellovibrionota bacterium]
MLDIYIDADGCPVKEEVYRVSERYKLKVFVVANKSMSIPLSSHIEMIVVSGSFDAADDWIAEQITLGDIVITADILLAERCIKKQARVLGSKGIEFTEDSIGSAVATRELMQNLRHMGEMRSGPAPMQKKDRSQFLGKLDQIIQALQRLKK